MPAILARDRPGEGDSDGDGEEFADDGSGDGEGVDSGSDTDVLGMVNSTTPLLYPFSIREQFSF